MPNTEIPIRTVEELNAVIDSRCTNIHHILTGKWKDEPLTNNNINRLRLELTETHRLHHAVERAKSEEKILKTIGRSDIKVPTVVLDDGSEAQSFGRLNFSNVKCILADGWFTFPDGTCINADKKSFDFIYGPGVYESLFGEEVDSDDQGIDTEKDGTEEAGLSST